MKVVLFCGGLGTRIREFSETIPKPMIEIGYRPIIWHLMRYYAYFGFKDFILCLGYRGDVIKNYFLNYDECTSNDFVLAKGGKEVRLYHSDISEWTISFVDTGLQSNIGQRLVAVKRFLGDDEFFMANYSDGLSDLNLLNYIDHYHHCNKIASFLSVKLPQTFHIVNTGKDNLVKDITPVSTSNLWANGGFFIFNKRIFDYINQGEELVNEPFQRLIEQKELVTYKHRGFFACMDTFREKQMLDEMYANGKMPWALWDSSQNKNKEPDKAPEDNLIFDDRNNNNSAINKEN